jgi:hypothetical protein
MFYAFNSSERYLERKRVAPRACASSGNIDIEIVAIVGSYKWRCGAEL